MQDRLCTMQDSENRKEKFETSLATEKGCKHLKNFYKLVLKQSAIAIILVKRLNRQK